jgi:hypothetical protein
VKQLYANAGELTWRTIFRRCANQGGIAERKTMIDHDHALSVSKQAESWSGSPGARCTTCPARAVPPHLPPDEARVRTEGRTGP